MTVDLVIPDEDSMAVLKATKVAQQMLDKLRTEYPMIKIGMTGNAVISATFGEAAERDMRTLEWIQVMGWFESRLGIGQETWGVVESYHLIDLINQTDLLEGVDRERKLGQPMVNFALNTPIGSFDFYYLPIFRPLSFVGTKGRPQYKIEAREEEATFESDQEEQQPDFALRYATNFRIVDLGVYGSQGTNREPEFRQATDEETGVPFLAPHYRQMKQTGVDLQLTIDELLIKVEHLWRQEDLEVLPVTNVDPTADPAADPADSVAGTIVPETKTREFTAFVAGIEYGFYGFIGATDLLFLTEYMRDNRGDDATHPYEDDLFIGFKWLANDTQDMQIHLSSIKDMSSKASFANFEMSRRLFNNFKFKLRASQLYDLPETDAYYEFHNDGHLEVELLTFF